MSQQPYSYGHYPGHQTQQPYQYSSAPAQADPGLLYGLPQEPNPAAVAGNPSSTNGSFDYNGNNIPGLGIGGGTGPSLAPSYRPERGNIWPQNTFGGVPNAVAPPHNQDQSIVGLGRHHLPHDPARSSGLASQTSANRSNIDVLEEGELSEGEFEDLYEPKGPDETVEDIPPQLVRPHGVVVDLSGSVGDADGSSIYDTGSAQEEVVVDSTPASLPAVDEEEEYSPGEYYEPEYQPRERSGSYSPYLSPREIQPEESVTKITPREAKQIASFQENMQDLFAGPNTTARQHPVDTSHSNSPTLPGAIRHNAHQSAGTHPNQSMNYSGISQATSSLRPTYKSVSEAKKKAQEAILVLWPFKVRFHDYLEEGIDLQVIKPLFTDLGLDTSSSESTTSVAKSVGLDTSSPKPIIPTPKPLGANSLPPKRNVTVQSNLPTPLTMGNTKSMSPNASEPATVPEPANSNPDKSGFKVDTKMANKSAQEERKDKIARMLAEKSKKSAAAIATSAPAAASSIPVVASTSTPDRTDSLKAKTRAENTMKLQQKLNALRKAQEEAEVKKKQDQIKQATTTTISNVENTTQTIAAVAIPAQQPLEQDSSSAEPDVPSSMAGIPGLSVVSTPQSSLNSRSLKRPVASDFDSYTPNGGSIKRTRTQETLIIDVSDDEDVEMDLGSPTEGPSSTIQNNASLARQNSLSAFPPLTNSHSWRGHRSSPVTPAVGTPSAHGHKLETLTQRIEEAKRKIAEAEAKKATKKPNGGSTPLAQSPAPALGNQATTRLPKVSEVVKIERRERIVSYQLPLVEAALREKQEKLARLQSEAAQLELEVKASIAERQKLTVEMEELGDGAQSEFKPDEFNGHKEPSESDATAVPRSGLSTIDVVTTSPQSPHPATNAVTDVRHSSDGSGSSRPVIERSPEAREETLSSSEKADMDIDSPESSADIEVSHVDTIPNATVDPSSVPDRSVLNDSPPAQNMSPIVEIAPNPIETMTPGGATASARVTAEATRAESRGNDLVVADIFMENLDTEMSQNEEDAYEPMPAQISNTDRIRVPTSEDGQVMTSPQSSRTLLIDEQILNKDPYEPSLAQVSGATANTAPKPLTDEVQLRSSWRPRLLTSEQTERHLAISAGDLLSYQSPLRYFHAYRFHPKFLDDVSGGLKSMTYSSRIDISRPLCPSFVDGGQCPNGPSCEFQHFDNMVLSDTDIIAQLGSTDMYTGEQKGRFIDGLKKVLNDLKANKVRDFDRITKAIVQYRANFLEDRSKILPLNNVAI